MFPDPSGIDDDAEGMTFLEHLFECEFESKEGFVEAAVGAYTHFLVVKALETHSPATASSRRLRRARLRRALSLNPSSSRAASRRLGSST